VPASGNGARVDPGAEAYQVAAERRVALERRLVDERRTLERRERQRRRRNVIRRRRAAVLLLASGLGTAAWSLIGASSGALPPKVAAGSPPSFVGVARDAAVVPGSLPAFSWPSTGEGALAVSGIGLMADSPKVAVVPIASLTKMMTAYLVLQDHPLTPGEDGPSLTMTAADYADWVHASQTDESNVPVKVGEVLSERQLLEGLMLQSGDNIADLLGIWVAGSDGAFVARMNATAAALGMNSTHYADTSGLSPASRSTAADQAVLAGRLMENPSLRSIVWHPSLPFPVAGTITNYNPALGVDGIIGVKSGFTSQAEACLATAAYRTVDHKSVLVVAVSLGQPGGLPGAATADETLLDEVDRAFVAYRPISGRQTVGTVSLNGGAPVPVRVVGPLPVVLGWPGLHITETIGAPPVGERHTSVVGEIVLSGPTGVLATAPVVALASSVH